MAKKSLTFCWDSSGAQDPLIRFPAVKGFYLLGASYNARAHGGSPTNSQIIVKSGTTAISGFTLTLATPGTPVSVTTTALGGSVALPAHIDAGTNIGLQLSFTGGTSPTASNGCVVLYIDEDE